MLLPKPTIAFWFEGVPVLPRKVQQNGLQGTGGLYFTSSNCSGTPYRHLAVTPSEKDVTASRPAAAARVIEELNAGKLDEQAAVLAHHWEQAGEPVPAAHWNARAARWAGSSADAAVRHWRKVIELLAALPEARETDALRLEASAEMLGVAWRVGMSDEETERTFTAGRVLAERLGDPVLHAKLLSAYGNSKWTNGDVEDYVEYGRRGGARAGRCPGRADRRAGAAPRRRAAHRARAREGGCCRRRGCAAPRGRAVSRSRRARSGAPARSLRRLIPSPGGQSASG